jgi:peptidoglycan hydrolase-like protein with peptidoglycan-binding domain
MSQFMRRWLAGAGVVTVVGAAVLGQVGVSGATTVATAARAAPARAATYVPAKRVIYFGEHGEIVRRLQVRLRLLHYYPGAVDGVFGQDTLEAVWAFKEVQGLGTRNGPDDVSLAMQRKLAHPRLPRVLVPHGGSNLRIEVNQSIQVLVLYHHNKVELISHVSSGGDYYYPCPAPYGGETCGPAITPDGDYRARWFQPGWLTVPLGQMYNPVFFIGGAYAIHGDIPVPLEADSHGCVRLPMDIAAFFHNLINISEIHGTPIYIRGHV